MRNAETEGDALIDANELYAEAQRSGADEVPTQDDRVTNAIT